MAFFKNREGLQLHYEEQGEGDVLLFLPGWGAPCIMYRPYMEALSGRINWFAYTNVPLLIVGALFTSLGWLIFSEFFYMYVNMVASGSMYGSLATIVFLMVWLYFCMFILFIGGEINEVLRRERRRQHRMEFQSRARKMDQLAKDQAEKELSMDPDMLDARPTRRIE